VSSARWWLVEGRDEKASQGVDAALSNADQPQPINAVILDHPVLLCHL
jgi:hypothetical protein